MGMKVAETQQSRASATASSSSAAAMGNAHGKAHANANANASTTVNVFMDWIDNNCGVDLMGCDESCATAGQRVLGKALHIQTDNKAPEPDWQSIDYAALHDELMESLLLEQSRMENSPLLEESSSTSNMSELSGAIDSRKRRRPVRMTRKRTPPRVRAAKALDTSNSSMSTISFPELAEKTDLPEPESYFHPQCRMQKDKGRGEAVGSNICAKGRDACLDKLRAKMLLLADHATPEASASRKGPATVKRRKARVSERRSNFIETRSLIELKMGFLSMQYGVLLRWDTSHTGKVTLVVLRKMCHESFYPKFDQPPLLREETTKQSSQPQSKQLRVEVSDINVLEPPYRIARPATFDPAVLRIHLVSATGLSPRSSWTVQLSYEDGSENFVLGYDNERNCFIPKSGEPLCRTLCEGEPISTLEVKLFEHRSRRRNSQRRLVTTMRVPLQGLPPQPVKTAVPNRVQLPFSHDNSTTLHLEFLLLDDQLHWMLKEREARRREQVTYLKHRDFSDPVEDEDKPDPWEWILCCVC